MKHKALLTAIYEQGFNTCYNRRHASTTPANGQPMAHKSGGIRTLRPGLLTFIIGHFFLLVRRQVVPMY